MAPATAYTTPGLASFLKGLSTEPVENSIDRCILLLKHRQIRGSKHCAIATAYLVRRVIAKTRAADPDKLIERVVEVGRRLVSAQPRELVVGNIVRRVLGLIRDEEDESRGEGDLSSLSSESGSRPQTPRGDSFNGQTTSPPHGITPRRAPTSTITSARPPLLTSHTGYASVRPVTSMFSILAHTSLASSGANSPATRSGTATPPVGAAAPADFRAEVMEGISEIIDELSQSDDQIAAYAPEYVHPNEVVLTYSSSMTVQRFLIKAASKRKFTVIHAEAYPNSHQKSHALVTGNVDSDASDLDADAFQKPLAAAGVTVVLVPDSAIFAVMSRVNKVILGAHAVLSNGSTIASAGAKMVSKAAKHHRVPVIVLAGTYKLSPKYPYDPDNLLESGDVAKVIPFEDADCLDRDMGGEVGLEVENPLYDFVDAEDVDLFVTNLGGCASGYLYRVVREQYRDEDVDL